ncbi:hypothetical protein [Candidatus Mycobacterium methanotrophicum]|nr:hypothetical protein [Candidatus Mycobacterium methanotrophicum]
MTRQSARDVALASVDAVRDDPDGRLARRRSPRGWSSSDVPAPQG